MEPITYNLRAGCPIPGGWRDLPVTVVYDDIDPYAVTFRFTDGPTWIFGRELLAEGLTTGTPTGRDVRIKPKDDAIEIVLDSPFGDVTLLFHRTDLQAFLDATLERVPLGAELVDWDRELRALGGAR